MTKRWMVMMSVRGRTREKNVIGTQFIKQPNRHRQNRTQR